jgi:hypothetical protein
MPGTLEFSEASLTLSDLLVAAYNISANTYGTPASMAVGQTLEIDWDFDNDDLVGYGATSRISSVPRAAKLKFGGGGVDSNIMAIIAGISNATSLATAHRRRRQLFGAGNQLPYFGCIGVADTDDGGVCVLGLQSCKLSKYPTFKADGKTNKFNMWESDGKATQVAIGGVNYFLVKQDYETKADWTAVLPATGANFLAFFTDFS